MPGTAANGPSMDLGNKVKDAVRDVGGRLSAVAAEKAEGFAARSKDAGVEAVEKARQTVDNVADTIEQDSPMIADYVRDAARNIDRVARGLKDHSVADLLSMATDFGRKQPLVFFAGAALVGFALARFMKSGVGATVAGPRADEDNIGNIGV